jgi:hypothetical protein
MERNTNPEINRLNMETSKQVAESLRGWAGLDSPKAPVASSFLNGSTAQMLNESSNSDFSPKSKSNTSFSFGLISTVSALKNSSMYDLPAGKIMLEKFEGLLISKGISEAFIIEGFLSELSSFSWESSVPQVLENLNNVFENRRREVEVVKAYETIKNTPGRELFSDATAQMKEWLVSEKRSSDSLIHGLRRFGFNPLVRNLVSFLSIYENQNSGKFHVGFDNNVCEVTSIYSPIMVSENGSIFYSSGKFFIINESDNTLSECSIDDVPEDFQNKSGMIADRDIKIGNNRISLNLGRNMVDIVFENNSKSILFDGKPINEADLPVAVSVSTNNLLDGSNNRVAKAIFVAKTAEEIVDIDFGKKIISKVYEGVEANIFKIGGKIYVQTVNPSMNLNNVYESNATQAINTIRDFIKYDITESLTEFLEGEQAFLSIMKNDKKEIIQNIEILEGELRKIDHVKSGNPLISNSPELLNLQESIESELENLKDRWNQINIEIEKFENNSDPISVNEEMGYPIDTEVRIKRNGVKGRVIGIDGGSKTYTILFKEGKTGEYFFSDVEDLGDEVNNYDIQTPYVELEFSEAPANESMDQELAEAPEERGSSYYDREFMNMVKKHMAAAPGKEAKGDPKFIDNEKNQNLAGTPSSGKKNNTTGAVKKGSQGLVLAPGKSAGKGKTFIDDLSDSNLAKAPSAIIKSQSKFIDDLKNQNLALKENQKNSHTEKAPKGKDEKTKRFIEDEKRASLSEAPGDHRRNGKKFVEDLDDAGLSAAPKMKSKKK